MIKTYGFAQIANVADEVRNVGWGIADAVGGVPPPGDYDVHGDMQDGDEAVAASPNLVYECASNNTAELLRWWTDERLRLLGKEANLDDTIIARLKQGRRLVDAAYSDGRYSPQLLTCAAVATMPPEDVRRQAAVLLGPRGKTSQIKLTKQHQRILRRYLRFFFTRKLEKLLQTLNKGLKDHYNTEIWTKACLLYTSPSPRD